jgi:predicted nucleic acid-binding protein
VPRILVDTNLLLRIADPGSSQHQAATDAVARLIADGHEVCICPQNMIEFWAVATRPMTANGLGWNVTETESEVVEMESHFVMLPDTPGIYTDWKRLVADEAVTGKRVHDARLAAVSRVHLCDGLLTFNAHDFAPIRGLILLDPDHPESWPIAPINQVTESIP